MARAAPRLRSAPPSSLPGMQGAGRHAQSAPLPRRPGDRASAPARVAPLPSLQLAMPESPRLPAASQSAASQSAGAVAAAVDAAVAAPSAPAGASPAPATAAGPVSRTPVDSRAASAHALGQAASPALAAELICHRQVRPDMPALALEEGIGGRVIAHARVLHGRVREVHIVSGPAIFHDAVRRAMLRYRCEDLGDRAVTVTQEFSFRLH